MWFSKWLNLTIIINTMLWGSIRTFLMLFIMSFITKVTKSLREKMALKACWVIYFPLFYGHFNKLSLIDRILSYAWVHLGCSRLHGNRYSSATHDSQTFLLRFRALLLFCMNHSSKTVPVLSSVICYIWSSICQFSKCNLIAIWHVKLKCLESIRENIHAFIRVCWIYASSRSKDSDILKYH